MKVMTRMQEKRKMKVKKGWVVVQVGVGGHNENPDLCSAFQRFGIPISYLYNPLLQGLLDEAREIYGYDLDHSLHYHVQSTIFFVFTDESKQVLNRRCSFFVDLYLNYSESGLTVN